MIKKLNSILGYILFRIIVLIFSIVPLNTLYILSTFLGFVLQRIIKYRKPIISKNLDIAFPSLSSDEKNNITSMYYQYMADLAIESIKSSTLTKKKFDLRYKTTNPELVKKYFDLNQNIMIVTAHIGNWEWAASLIGSIDPHICLGVYKPLSNPYMEGYIRKTRSRFNTVLVRMKEVRKYLNQSFDKPYSLILVADQSPSNTTHSIWTNLFDINTPFAHGLDDISRERKLPVIYADIKKVGRGHYELTFSELVKDPSQHERGYITKEFAKRIEQVVKERKADWLWSHKRWKKIKPSIY